MKSATTATVKKPYATLSMEQIRKDLEAAKQSGRNVISIDFNEVPRESGDGAVTYRNVYWTTSDNRVVIPIVEFKYNFICATKPLENRKISKVKKAQLSITKRKARDGMDDKDIKKLSADEETFNTLMNIDKSIAQYLKDCLGDGRIDNDNESLHTNAQLSLSKKTIKENKDAKMEEPFLRYEFKISDKPAGDKLGVFTEFFDDNEKNYNTSTKRFEYTNAAKKTDITNENVHSFFTSESFVRAQIAFSMNTSQYGVTLKAFVKRVYYRTNIKPQNIQSVEATDDDVEDFEEYKRMKEALAKMNINADKSTTDNHTITSNSATSNDDIDSAFGDDE